MNNIWGSVYTFYFTVEQSGDVSIHFSLLSEQGVLEDFYYGTGWNEPMQYSRVSPNLRHYWGNGDVFPGRRDYLSGRFYSYVKAPYTGAYNINM